MGNYSIVIHGIGTHDNNKADDVEQMVNRFAADLAARGHTIEDVRVTIGTPKRIMQSMVKVANALPAIADAQDDLCREARAAYERYGAHAGWKTFDGRPMPDWEALTPIVQQHWCAAVDWYDVMLTRNVSVVGPGTEGDHIIATDGFVDTTDVPVAVPGAMPGSVVSPPVDDESRLASPVVSTIQDAPEEPQS